MPNQRVLITDDDVAACMVLKRWVENMGMTCDVAKDGGEAVAACSAKIYDVVLMDTLMPGKNGWEASVEIGKICAGQNLPFIVGMVSIDDEVTRRQCHECGMGDVLCKPISRIALQQSIERRVVLSKRLKTEINSFSNSEIQNKIFRDAPSSITRTFSPPAIHLESTNDPRPALDSSRRYLLLLNLLQAQRAAMSAARSAGAAGGRACQKSPERNLRNEAE
jgi:CheY-like chemotaxis protein